ncbi:hypothetical protein GCM10023339_09420 [Alloalcanivorax gelatiniphagus]
MTEFTAPFVRQLITGPTPPAPRVAPDDDQRAPSSDPVPSRRLARRTWQQPLADAVGAAVCLLVGQAFGLGLAPIVLAALVVTWPLALAVAGCYAVRPIEEPMGERLGRVLRACGAVGLMCWAAAPFAGTVGVPDVTVPAVALLTGGTLALRVLHVPPVPLTRLVVAGDPAQVRHAVLELSNHPAYDVVGACVSRPPGDPDGFAEAEVHVGVADTVEVARAHQVDAVLLLPGPELPAAVLRRLQWQAPAAGLHVYLGTGLLDVSPSRMSVVQGAGLDLLHVRHATLDGPSVWVKTILDRVLAALGLLALMPLLLVVGLAIRLDSSGPAIFRQTRVGRFGDEFTMFKFRTMSTTAEQQKQELSEDNECDYILFKVRADPRITRIGQFLRRYSVDEVPQLWNVVRGDMSLIGPRPALPGEVERYDFDPRRRLAVRPGLTGLWQVSGRSDLSWEESVRLDVRYVDNWSLGLDFAVLRRTVRAVVGHRGAY